MMVRAEGLPTHPLFPICRTPFPPYVRNYFSFVGSREPRRAPPQSRLTRQECSKRQKVGA